jgi:hypothetical protein
VHFAGPETVPRTVPVEIEQNLIERMGRHTAGGHSVSGRVRLCDDCEGAAIDHHLDTAAGHAVGNSGPDDRITGSILIHENSIRVSTLFADVSRTAYTSDSGRTGRDDPVRDRDIAQNIRELESSARGRIGP